MTLAEIRARLKVIATEMRALAERDLTEAEQREFDALLTERDSLEGKLQRMLEATRSAELSDRAENGFPCGPTSMSVRRHEPENCRDDFGTASDVAPVRASGCTFRMADGREVRSLRRGEPLTPRGASLPPIGEVLRAMITGDSRNLGPAEARAAVANVDAKGGHLLTPAMSSMFIDLARSASVVEKAGATVLPLETSETILARLESDATAHWVGEMQAATSSDPGFSKITLRPRTLVAVVPISVELCEDSQNAAALIEQALQRSLAAEVDRCVLNGAGKKGEILGITLTTGVNEETSVGTPDSYDEIADAVTSILEANYDGELSNLSWIQHPTIAGIYAKLVTGTELQPLQPGPWVAPLKRLHTTSLPTTTALVGDFSQVVLGMRTSGVRVEVFDAGTATDASGTTVNAITQLAKFIRAYIRMDCCIMRPTWMTKLTGITTGE